MPDAVARPPPGADHPGAVLVSLERYELLAELASGGMGTVYLGRARGMAGFQRLVAVKCCHPHLRTDPDFVAMFLDEARIAARIHHPHVVATLDVGEGGERLFLVMEYIEGARVTDLLKAAVRSEREVPLGVGLRVLCDALSGLHAAHELRDGAGTLLEVVHRDVTPHNIMVGVDGVSRLMDFGIAKAAVRASVTREGHIKGNLGYMSPEQLTGREVDRRADLFSAGVVLWELLAGRRLFRAATDAETAGQVLHAPIPPLSQVRSGIPPALDAALQHALERRPEARFSTAAEFCLALEACGVPLAPPREVGRYVEESVPELLSERRALLRSLETAGPTASPLAAPAAGKTLSSDSALENTSPTRRLGRRLAPWILVGAAAATAAFVWISPRTRDLQSSPRESPTQPLPSQQTTAAPQPRTVAPEEVPSSPTAAPVVATPPPAQPAVAEPPPSTPQAAAKPGRTKVRKERRQAAPSKPSSASEFRPDSL